MLVINPFAGEIGGTERHSVLLARTASEAGWRVRLVFPALGAVRDERLRAWCVAQGFAAETTPAVRDSALPCGPRDLARLAALVRASRADAIVINYGAYPALRAIAAIRLARPRARLIVEVHSVLDWNQVGIRRRSKTRRTAALSSRMVVHSRPVLRSLLAAGVPKEKTVIFPYAIPPPASPPTRTRARASMGVPDDAVVVGTAARLCPEKGVADLIEAVAEVPDPTGRVHLLIAGDGELRTDLEQLARLRLGSRAHFLGHIVDLAPFYSSLDLFALAPIWDEAFGLVYIEAAHHGVPSVASRVGGVADVVVDEATGLLATRGDRRGLVAALSRLIADPPLRQTLGAAAQARARALYGVERLLTAYAAILG
jgi:phosphatidylinositol alpha-1,6-mannosyltransferase